MATWQTEIQKVKNDVMTRFGDGRRAINDFFTGTVNKKVSEVNSFFKNGTTVVGINVTKIPDMKKAISTYVEAVDTALDELVKYDPTVAFQGTEIVAALNTYIEAVKTACSAITSNMLAFNDQLTDVQEAYAKKDDAAASIIKQSAESTASAYTAYKPLTEETEATPTA